MKLTTREWVERAEADFSAALLLRQSRKKHIGGNIIQEPHGIDLYGSDG